MSRRVMFIIDSDPRVSGRAAEAVRIAAGASVWAKIEVALYLRGAAVAMLSQDTGELVDEENLRRYLSILGESGGPIYVQRGAAGLANLGESTVPFEEISDGELTIRAAHYTSVIRF